MSFLRTLFGPSRKEVWRQLSREVDGQFHDGGFFKASAVQARSHDWIITLDTYTTGNGKSSQTWTRLRAPFFNPEGFRFEIRRASVFSGLGKAMGMQDVEVGHRRFDDDFVIKGNAQRRLRRLFDNAEIRRLIDAQPRIHLSVKGHDAWFGKFPAGMDELHFQAHGVIKDLARLRNLFDLFTEVLRQVAHEGRAEDDVHLHKRRLRAPGGRISRDRYVLWEGDRPRRDAAAALGRLRDPAGIPALASVLRDEDALLAARAIEALALIRDRRTVGPLIRPLGDRRGVEGAAVGDRAADALRSLGEGHLVDIVLGAFGGDFGHLKAYDGDYRTEVIEALGDVLDGVSGVHAANALSEIHAVEALPRLREALRSKGAEGPTRRQAIERAIRKLEARASLPRAASAADVAADTLPRSARKPL